jgi:isopentenyl phosphate kinase
MKKKIYFIKYGGSVVTDKHIPHSVSAKDISSLNSQIDYLHQESDDLFIIGNGGGSFGHYYAQKYQLYDNSINKQTFLGICCGKCGNDYLNRLIVEDLLRKGLTACSVRISVPYLLEHNKYSWQEIISCLQNCIIPVIYGDILFYPKNKYTIISTEQAFVDLSYYLHFYFQDEYEVAKFILCTDTNGVIDNANKTVSLLTTDAQNKSIFWTENGAFDVTGGMKGKVEKSFELAKIAPVQIVNGHESDCIIRAVRNETLGTLIKGR